MELSEAQAGYVVSTLLRDLDDPEAVDPALRRELGELYASLTGEQHPSFSPRPVLTEADRQDLRERERLWLLRHPGLSPYRSLTEWP